MDKWDPKWNSDSCSFEEWNSTIGWYSSVQCKTLDNYWAGAKKACDELGMSLPDDSKLRSIYATVGQYSSDLPYGYLWSSSEDNTFDYSAYIVRSYDGATFNSPKYRSPGKVLCVGD